MAAKKAEHIAFMQAAYYSFVRRARRERKLSALTCFFEAHIQVERFMTTSPFFPTILIFPQQIIGISTTIACTELQQQHTNPTLTLSKGKGKELYRIYLHIYWLTPQTRE